MAQLKRIPEFEGLRGFLAWWVLIFHVITIAGFSENDFGRGIRLLIRGEYPVDVFIILSGFVIFMLLDTKHQGYWTFITQRFFRLYPVFIVVFMIAILAHPLRLASLQLIPWPANALDTLRMVRWHETDAYFWENILTHLTLFHSAIPETYLPTASTAFLSPAWSISLEWQFYIIAPGFLFLLNRYKAPLWIAFIVTVYFSNRMFHGDLLAMFPLQGFLLQKLLLFWIGIISFFFWKALLPYEKLSAYLGFLIFAGICPLIFPFTLSIPLTIWLITLSVAMASQQNQTPSRWISFVNAILCNRVAQYMGAISYCLYLCHEVCIWLTHWVLMQTQTIHSRQDLVLWLGCISGLLSLGVASCLHFGVEIPGIRLGRKLTQRQQ